MDLTNGIVAVASACLGGGAAGFFSWLNERIKAKAPATIASSQAAFAQALNSQTEAFIKALQENRAHLEGQVAELSDKVAGLEEDRSRLRDRVGELENENERCIGEGRQMAQRVDSLEAYLRRNGVAVPARAAATGLVEMSGGKTTVLMTTTDKPRSSRRRRGKNQGATQ